MFLLKIILALVSVYFTIHGAGAEGFVLAMAGFTGGLYTSDMQTYRRLLDTRMQKVAWNLSFWQAFMGFIGGKKSMFDPVVPFGVKDPTKQKPTGSPIEVLQDFAHLGGVDIDIPIYYPLTGTGVVGSETLKGKGEKPKLGIIKTCINQVRHAYVAQDNKMSKQVLQSPAMVKRLMRSASEYLGDWFQRYLAYQPYLAFLEGYSENLTREVGGNVALRTSHMNIYTHAGRVTFSTTAGTYEAAVAAAVTELAGSSSVNYFSTDAIEAMVFHASHSHKIKPMLINGMRLYPIVISDASAKQLAADTKWNDRMKYAAERSLNENPLFTGKIAGVYGGAFLIVDETVPSVYVTADGSGKFSATRSTDAATTGVCYGTENATTHLPNFMDTPVDSGPIKPAILFGASALTMGVASDLSFEDEFDDFKQKHEVGADMICGIQVADIIDTDGYFGTAGNKRYENNSSLIGLFNSPVTTGWGSA